MHSKLKKVVTIVGVSLLFSMNLYSCKAAEEFTFLDMTQAEEEATGITKLSAEERNTLESWIKDWSKSSREKMQNDCQSEPQAPEKEPPTKELLTREEAENLIIALEDSTEEPKTQTTTFAISTIREDGKFIDLENKVSYKVPSLLRRKAAKWNTGDQIEVQTTKKPQWVRLVNSKTHEHVLAKIETQDASSSQKTEQKTDDTND